VTFFLLYFPVFFWDSFIAIDTVLSMEHTIEGRLIDVKKALPKGGNQPVPVSATSMDDARKLFVGGLSLDLTEQEFGEYFMQYGNVIDAVIMVDRVTGVSRGFGFITFDNDETVQNLLALQKTSEHLAINGKVIEMKHAQPKELSRCFQTGDVRGRGGRDTDTHRDRDTGRDSGRGYHTDRDRDGGGRRGRGEDRGDRGDRGDRRPPRGRSFDNTRDGGSGRPVRGRGDPDGYYGQQQYIPQQPDFIGNAAYDFVDDR
jgi:heterogeneous nuclear ribonucleoprotein A1/A3